MKGVNPHKIFFVNIITVLLISSTISNYFFDIEDIKFNNLQESKEDTDSEINIGNIVPLGSSVSTLYEHEFLDDFINLDNWSNSSIAPYTVGGVMIASNGHIGGSSYGEDSTNWHGPAICTNFSMIDFRIEITPKCQASAYAMGAFSIALYSGEAGSGTLLWHFRWADVWYTGDSYGKLWLLDQDENMLWGKGESTAVGSWDDLGDNMTLIRSNSTLKLYIDGYLEYVNTSQSTALVKSVVVQFCQNKNDRPICNDLRLDKIKIDYNNRYYNYDFSFIDDFDNLDYWLNSTRSPLSEVDGNIDGAMTTSNGHLLADSYGVEQEVWHGPAIYRNISMTDFRFEIIPKCQASYQDLGKLSIGFYSEEAGLGTQLWCCRWRDAWWDEDVADLRLNDQDDTT